MESSEAGKSNSGKFVGEAGK